MHHVQNGKKKNAPARCNIRIRRLVQGKVHRPLTCLIHEASFVTSKRTVPQKEARTDVTVFLVSSAAQQSITTMAAQTPWYLLRHLYTKLNKMSGNVK